MSTIRYFVPEDGDTEACPNVFLAPKSAKPGYPPLLGQVRTAFPLPGKYHFRFKSPLVPGAETRNGGGGIAVWMDCTDDAQPVGVWNNSIVAKVTRISYDDDDDDEEFVSIPAAATASNGFHHSHSAPPSVAGTPHVTPRSTPPPTDTMPATVQEDHLNIFDDGPSPAPLSTNSAGATPPPSGNLLGGLDEPAPPTATAAASDATLLDMNHHHTPPSASSATSHDFFGGGTTAAPSSGGAHDDLLNMSAPVPQPMPHPQAQHHPPPGAAAPRAHHPNHFPGGMGMAQQRPGQRPTNNFGGVVHGKPQQPNRVASATYGKNPMGGMANAQQQQQQRSKSGGTRQNGNGKNAFDSFKKNQSPFAEFGNFT